MKKIILVLSLCSIFLCFGIVNVYAKKINDTKPKVVKKAQAVKQPIVRKEVKVVKKATVVRDNPQNAVIDALITKVHSLEQGQRSSNIILVLNIIFTACAAAVGFFSLGKLKKGLYRDFENSKNSFKAEIDKQNKSFRETVDSKIISNRKELMDAISGMEAAAEDTRANSVNSQLALRKELYQYAQNLIEETTGKADMRFEEFEKRRSEELAELNAKYETALEKTRSEILDMIAEETDEEVEETKETKESEPEPGLVVEEEIS